MTELEYIFKKIVDIDQKSNDVLDKTKTIIMDKEKELKLNLKEIEKSLIQDLNLELKTKKQEYILNAQHRAEDYLSGIEEQCNAIKEEYSLIKEDLKYKLVQEILET